MVYKPKKPTPYYRRELKSRLGVGFILLGSAKLKITNKKTKKMGKKNLASAGQGKKGKYTYKPQYGVIVICSDEKHQKQVFEHLKQFGYKLKIVSV